MKRFIARHVLQLHSHVKKDGTARSRRADNELEDAVVCRSKERPNSELEIRIPFLRQTCRSPITDYPFDAHNTFSGKTCQSHRIEVRLVLPSSSKLVPTMQNNYADVRSFVLATGQNRWGQISIFNIILAP
jgi:hypothetical protein